MGYDLRMRRQTAGSVREQTLHLSVWEMSKIRDRMLDCGAAHCDASPSDGSLRGRRTPGIAAYKLAMIDGFVVHPREIKEALAAMEDADPPTGREALWKCWTDFLGRAEYAGGFIVE